MLEATFRLLKEGKEYMNADVLWVSDFKIPHSSPVFMEEIRRCREAGTHFYGLQIGITDNEWAPFFDHIYRVEYTPSRQY